MGIVSVPVAWAGRSKIVKIDKRRNSTSQLMETESVSGRKGLPK